MKRFIYQLSLFSLIVFLALYALFLKADGKSDPFYLRFTSPQQQNLIIGTSRAAQGIVPEELSAILGIEIYNYSFTLKHSPFGEVYSNSIKKKLDPKTTDGTFIIAVDPWSISSIKDDEGIDLYKEEEGFIAKTPFVNIKPNPFYLLRGYGSRLVSLLRSSDGSLLLHNDGWLEVTVPMDSSNVVKRRISKIESYKNKQLPIFSYSKSRLSSLLALTNYLNNYGKVYLVRLPVSQPMLELENQLMPDFDEKLKPVTSASAGYLDLSQDASKYEYIDGNHIYKESGKEVSKVIAVWIKDNKLK